MWKRSKKNFSGITNIEFIKFNVLTGDQSKLMQHFYLMPDQLIKLQQYHPLKQNKYFCIALIIQYACGKWCYWPTLFSYRKLLRSEGLGSVIVSLLFLVVRFLLTKFSFFWGRNNVGTSYFKVRPPPSGKWSEQT